MSAADSDKTNFEHHLKLGKLTLAIIEHSVEPVLGKDAIEVIKGPYSNRELYDNLCELLARAEKRFVEENSTSSIATGLMDLQLANLEPVRKSFWEFAKNPANPDFPRLVYYQFCQDYPSISDPKRRSAVTRYMTILKEELISINEETRQKVSSVALLSIQSGVENIADKLDSIDKSAKTIADLLSQRNPPATPTAVAAKANQENPSVLIPGKKTRILIIFAGCFEKDTQLARALIQKISTEYEVVSQDLLNRDGSEWAEKIEGEIGHSSLVIPIISEGVSLNELLIFEIDHAYHLYKSQNAPRIVPIRLRYKEPYPYPLSEYISEVPCILADNCEKESIEKVVIELNKMLSGLPFGVIVDQGVKKNINIPRPLPSIDPYKHSIIDDPKGTMDPESRFYIRRPQDDTMESKAVLERSLINIKAPRQMGKSSMLVRGVKIARNQGNKKIVYLDFQQLDSEQLNDRKLFYITFCNWVADNLNIKADAESFWKSSGSNNLKCTKFFKEYLLANVNQPLMLAIDEVDRLLGSPFKSDFFGLLRSWHIDRQNEEMSHLSMMLVISTEPVLLIDDISSPFNVGANLDLDDFLPEQVTDLNIRHGSPFSDSQLLRLMTLVGGHPFLVRQAMYKVCAKEVSSEKLLSTAASDDGPYGDHLLHHLFRINRSPELRHALWQILKENSSPSDELTYRLKSAGLVRQEGDSVVVRYGIYADYFNSHLKGG